MCWLNRNQNQTRSKFHRKLKVEWLMMLWNWTVTNIFYSFLLQIWILSLSSHLLRTLFNALSFYNCWIHGLSSIFFRPLLTYCKLCLDLARFKRGDYVIFSVSSPEFRGMIFGQNEGVVCSKVSPSGRYLGLPSFTLYIWSTYWRLEVNFR